MRKQLGTLIAGICVCAAAGCSAGVRPYANGEPLVPGGDFTPGGPAAMAPPMAPPAATGEWAALDVMDEGIDATIAVPDGAIVHDATHGVRITAGSGFAIEITPVATDIAARKVAIEADSVRQLIGFRTASADTLVYETTSPEGGRSEFHAVTTIESGGKVYTCQDSQEQKFSYAEALTMVRACWSLTDRTAGDALK